jgi:hypothetical protein
MPKNLKGYYGRGDLHFVTFSCYRRIPLLRTIGARNVFVKALGAVRDRYKPARGAPKFHFNDQYLGHSTPAYFLPPASTAPMLPQLPHAVALS